MSVERVERWKVRECVECRTLWPLGVTLCQYCARFIDRTEPLEVVRAAGARTSDPDTSKLAALRQAPRSGSQRARILAWLRENGPATARQVESGTAISGAWKRISELKQGGHIHIARWVYDAQTCTDVASYAASPETPGQETLL